MKRKPTIHQLMQKLANLRPCKDISGYRCTQRSIEFNVWRAGSSVNWECTGLEISLETGLSTSKISRVCQRRGWKLIYVRGGDLSSRRSIDTIIAKPAMMNGGAT